MNEVGGYFQFEQLVNVPYHENVIKLNNARNALHYLILSRDIQKLYIPSYLGNSIADFLNSRKIEFSYYHINDQFHPPLTIKLQPNEYIVIVNFYGQLTNARIQQLHVQYERIIIDNTQAFFQLPVKNIDTIYSCRKYFGIPDGAYLYTNNRLALQLAENKVQSCMTHLIGRGEKNAKSYYTDFIHAENDLSKQPMCEMSNVSKNMLGALPYNNIIERRNENYAYYLELLQEENLLQLLTPFAPFCYPLLLKNGHALRRKLIKKNIYIPTYWSTIHQLPEASEQDRYYADNLLALPCDQRYTQAELQIVVNEIKEWQHAANNLFEKI